MIRYGGKWHEDRGHRSPFMQRKCAESEDGLCQDVDDKGKEVKSGTSNDRAKGTS